VECPTEPVQSSYTGADSYTTVGVTCEE
jgi:hypothetical protein